jgi:hypothetical protein
MLPMQITHISLADIIGLIVVIAFLFTTVLTVLSLFGFGQPPRYYVTLEDKYKKVLFRSLIVELVVICLGVASSNFYNVKKANAKASDLEVKNAEVEVRNGILSSTALRNYIFPNGPTAPPSAEKLSQLKSWMHQQGLESVKIESFLESNSLEEARKRAVQELAVIAYNNKAGNKAYKITDVPDAELPSIIASFQVDNTIKIDKVKQPDGNWTVNAIYSKN